MAATIERWLTAGVARVVLGTAAVRAPQLVVDACARFPDRVAVGIDARHGLVAVDGWTETSTLMAAEVARRSADAGVAAIVYTDIERDGALTGPNVAATEALARAVAVPVIASGGIASLDDLERLSATGVIAGAISGRALYDGRIDLAEALALLED